MQKSYRTIGYFFVVPALIIVAIVTFFPYLYAIFISFHEMKYGTLIGFSGLDNYVRVLKTDTFQKVVVNQTIIIVFSALFQFLLGISGALALNRRSKTAYALRSALLVPWVIPGVVCGLLWKWILDGNAGVVNLVLSSAGIIDKNIAFLSDSRLALVCIIIVNIWRVFPFMMVMYLAGLQSVPSDQYEAALVDGANFWHRLIWVTFPNMKPVIALTMILSTIWNFKLFDIVWTLTRGGPSQATEVFGTLIYKSSVQDVDFGFSSATAVLMALIMAIPIAVYQKLSVKKA